MDQEPLISSVVLISSSLMTNKLIMKKIFILVATISLILSTFSSILIKAETVHGTTILVRFCHF